MKNVIVSVLFVMAVQIQFTANAYVVYPALSIPKWFSEPFIDYAPISPANYPDVTVAGPWAYLSVSPVGQVVEQVPYILTDVPGFLSHQDAVASDLVRTKCKTFCITEMANSDPSFVLHAYASSGGQWESRKNKIAYIVLM